MVKQTTPKLCIKCQKNPKRPKATKYCEQCLEELKPIWQQNRYEITRKWKQSQETTGLQKRAKRKSPQPCPSGQKWCHACEQFLELTQFGKTKERYNSYCKVCQSELAHIRNLKKYSIGLSQYLEILELQEGRCFICRNKPRKMRLAVDHNHKTGEVRGLLCMRCNRHILGASHENPVILRRAAEYLDNPPARLILKK